MTRWEMRILLAWLIFVALTGCWRQPDFFVPIVWFSLLNGALLWAGWRVSGLLLPGATGSVRAVAAALGGTAWIIVGFWLLSLVGWMTLWGASLLVSAAFLVALLFARPVAEPESRKHSDGYEFHTGHVEGERAFVVSRAMHIVWLSLLVAALAVWLIDGRTGNLYQPVQPFNDSAAYHLHFVATWLHAGFLKRAVIPFHEMAAATYFPANAELVYLFWTLPFHAETVSKVGQFPLALLGAMSLASLVAVPTSPSSLPGNSLRSGKTSSNGRSNVLPSLVGAWFMGSVLVASHSVTADADVAHGVFYLSCVLFAVRCLENGRLGDGIYLGVAVGLFLGTKYTALVFLLTLIPLLAAAGWQLSRRQGLRGVVAGLAGVVVLAGPWYLRNAILTGNPLFPVQLEFGDWTLFEGVYDREVMRASQWHVDTGEIGLLLQNLTKVVFFPLLIPAWLAGWGIGWKQWRQWHRRYLDLLPLIYVAVFWWLNPYNTELRFLIPVVGLVCLTAARSFAALWGLGLGFSLLALGSWIESYSPGGFVRVGQTMARWVSGDFAPALLPQGSFILAPHRTTILGLLAGGVVVLIWFTVRRSRPSNRPVVGPPSWLMVGWGWLLMFWLVRPVPVGSVPSFYPAKTVGPYPDAQQGAYLERNVRNSIVAFSGTHLPFYLSGVGLSNEVVYVNVEGSQAMLWHDFWHERHRDHAERRARAIVPIEGRTRDEVDDETPWLANLTASGAEWFAVFPILNRGFDYVRDREGYPVERRWADRNPQIFELIRQVSDRHIRLYRIHRAALVRPEPNIPS